MNVIRLICLLAITLSFCASCITTTEIGINRNFTKGGFKVGESSKSDVVNYLGLPQKIEKGENGTERFVYHSEALVTNADRRTLLGSTTISENVKALNRRAIYIFSIRGILIKKIEPKVEKDTQI